MVIDHSEVMEAYASAGEPDVYYRWEEEDEIFEQEPTSLTIEYSSEVEEQNIPMFLERNIEELEEYDYGPEDHGVRAYRKATVELVLNSVELIGSGIIKAETRWEAYYDILQIGPWIDVPHK
jgi:hypothetical protein